MGGEVIMPALGMAQDTGRILRWLKQPGEAVVRGEPLVEIETDKVTTEIEAPASGVLASVTADDGADVPVGQVIARIIAPGEAVGGVSDGDGGRGDQASPSAGGTPLADEPAVTATAAGPPVPPSGPGVAASPKARRLAREQGVDLSRVQGRGPGGVVLGSDVMAAGNGSPAASPARLSLAWETMAERMAHSWATVPHFFLSRDIDAGGLARRQAQSRGAIPEATVTDLLVQAVARALVEHPEVNASWREGGIVRHPRANVGIAVAGEDGLVVPVIHGAEGLSLVEISRRRRDLVERARSRKLRLDDVEDGTFTISNLGMHGVDRFSAIINEPEAAILAVGAIRQAVALEDGMAVNRPLLGLTLSCDHRVIDGVRGARFLATIARLLTEAAPPGPEGVAGAVDGPGVAG